MNAMNHRNRCAHARLLTRVSVAAASVAVAALLVPSVRAQSGALAVQLTPSLLQAERGQILTFSGMLTNGGDGELFLNSAAVRFTDPGVSGDASPFTFGAPASLAPGESWSGSLFGVTVDADAEAPRDYLGTFRIQGGGTPSSAEPIGSASFTVRVTAPTAVPEPSAVVLLVMAGLAMIGAFAIARPAVLRRRTGGDVRPTGGRR